MDKLCARCQLTTDKNGNFTQEPNKTSDKYKIVICPACYNRIEEIKVEVLPVNAVCR